MSTNTKKKSVLAPIAAVTAVGTLLILVLIALLGVTASARAQSTTGPSMADLLEKGIYTEQTVGDLPAAIEIYEQIVANAAANRPHVAEAKLRLALCHLKQGDEAATKAALEELIRDFPEQERLVAQAREHLAAVQPALALESTPWTNGELLEYRVSLPTGKVLGLVYQMVQAARVDGIEAWQVELRKLIFTAANNHGSSRVWVERDGQRPIRSLFRHGILGNADAVYGPDEAEITGGARDTRVSLDNQDVYDNEQIMHLLRVLPLEVGYKTKLHILPTWVAHIVEVDLEVTGQESCEVPAGAFECFVLRLDVEQGSQQMWISTGPEHYLVKQEGGGIVLELGKVGHFEPGAPVPFGLQAFAFSGQMPAGWLATEQQTGRSTKGMVRLLDPDSEAISAVEIDRCPGACPTLTSTAEQELAGAKERFTAYTLREGSWTERSIDGRSAISFVGDYQVDGKPWVQYRLYTLTDDKRFEFIFRAPASRFETLKADFDAVAESLRTQ